MMSQLPCAHSLLVSPLLRGTATLLISLSRSLGDLAHKRVPGVIAVPWVTSTELQPGHHVAAVALTDGITDVMSLDTVGKLVAEELAKVRLAGEGRGRGKG